MWNDNKCGIVAVYGNFSKVIQVGEHCLTRCSSSFFRFEGDKKVCGLGSRL